MGRGNLTSLQLITVKVWPRKKHSYKKVIQLSSYKIYNNANPF